MSRDSLRSSRLVALFLLGALGFSAPLLRLASRKVLVLGLPLAWIYLFGVWLVLIAVLAWTVRRRGGE